MLQVAIKGSSHYAKNDVDVLLLMLLFHHRIMICVLNIFTLQERHFHERVKYFSILEHFFMHR